MHGAKSLTDIGSWRCHGWEARRYWVLAHMAVSADIIVVGGGIVGASFALQLAASNLRVAVIDRNSPAATSLEGEFDHRVYALTPTNMALLDDLGVFQLPDRARLTPIRTMEIFSGRQAKLEFSARAINRNELAVMIEHRLLATRLSGKLSAAEHVQYFDKSAPKSLNVGTDANPVPLKTGQKNYLKMIDRYLF